MCFWTESLRSQKRGVCAAVRREGLVRGSRKGPEEEEGNEGGGEEDEEEEEEEGEPPEMPFLEIAEVLILKGSSS